MKIMLKSFSIIFLGMLLSSCLTLQKQEELNEKEIKIGALLPLTGDMAYSGTIAEAAIRIAAAEMNEKLSKKQSKQYIRLYIEDTESKPEEALEKLKKLKEKGVVVVVGPDSSSEIKAVKEFADDNDMLILSYASTSPALTIEDDNVFRLTTDDSAQAKAIASLLKKDGKKYVIQIWRNDNWGKLLQQTTKRVFSADKGTVIAGITYSPKLQNFDNIIDSLRSTVAIAKRQYKLQDVAIQVISLNEITSLLSKAKFYPVLEELNWYGCDANTGNIKLLDNKDACEFAVKTKFSCPYFAWDFSDNYENVKTRIENVSLENATNFSIIAYDCLKLLAKTKLAAKSNDIDVLKDQLMTISKSYYGATGSTKLNDAGDRQYQNFDILRIIKDKSGYTWQIKARYHSKSDVFTPVN